MTKKQLQEVTTCLLGLFNSATEFHLGDCVGADEQFFQLVRAMFSGTPKKVVLHPPSRDRYRAHCEKAENLHALILEVRPVKEYLERNDDIVAECDLILATPKEAREVSRSGT